MFLLFHAWNQELTSSFSFTSIRQCSSETVGSWTRMSHVSALPIRQSPFTNGNTDPSNPDRLMTTMLPWNGMMILQFLYYLTGIHEMIFVSLVLFLVYVQFWYHLIIFSEPLSPVHCICTLSCGILTTDFTFARFRLK